MKITQLKKLVREGKFPLCEVLRSEVVPYYGYIVLYGSENEQKLNKKQDYLDFFELLKKTFPTGKIYTFCRDEVIPSENLWGYTFHALVRGVGRCQYNEIPDLTITE